MGKEFKPLRSKRIAKFARYKDTCVQVHINEFDDYGKSLMLVDFRQFAKDEDGDYQPTNKGLSIHRDHLLLLQKAVNKAIRKLDVKEVKKKTTATKSTKRKKT